MVVVWQNVNRFTECGQLVPQQKPLHPSQLNPQQRQKKEIKKKFERSWETFKESQSLWGKSSATSFNKRLRHLWQAELTLMRSNGVECRRHCNAGAVQEARVSEETGFQDHSKRRETFLWCWRETGTGPDGWRPADYWIDSEEIPCVSTWGRETAQRSTPRERIASRHGLSVNTLGN